MTTTADVLERAADRLRDGAWWRGKAGYEGRGANCIVTAIGRAAGAVGTVSYNEARDTMVEHMGFTNSDQLIEWNDHIADSKETVIRELRACAAKLRGGV